LVYAGSIKSRKITREVEFFFNLKAADGSPLHVPKFNVLLTSYEVLRKDFLELAKIEWQVLIVDEG